MKKIKKQSKRSKNKRKTSKKIFALTRCKQAQTLNKRKGKRKRFATIALGMKQQTQHLFGTNLLVALDRDSGRWIRKAILTPPL